MELIGQISSMATLILFMFYFVGRGITLSLERKLKYENFEIYYGDKFPENIKIVDEYNVGNNTIESLIITSEKELNWIKVFEFYYNKKNKDFKKGKLVVEHKHLRSSHSIKINTYLPCGIPQYILEFQRYDYLNGTLKLAENGENGIVDVNIEMHHTLKSILYYLVR